ncbi:MAG: glycosyltransferase [Gammaproteobacteria bacterium]|nr:glycosyltransferase [Gammaproteobacteria bacterium]
MDTEKFLISSLPMRVLKKLRDHTINKIAFSWRDLFFLYLYIAALITIVMLLPTQATHYYDTRTAFIALGLLGIWRYSWWGLHVIRSFIYAKFVFPRRRLLANQLWQSGWRPTVLYIMMTTYNELKETTEKVLDTLVNESKHLNIPIKLFVGIGSEYDQQVITDFFSRVKSDFINVRFVQQKMPGKRYAIGETLRSMVVDGLAENDPVIFMDGDTYFTENSITQCLPFFEIYPKLQALTTHEQAIVYGAPHWMKKWLEMRFIQRHFTMQSYALSNKVLTLTGRMSMFRGKHLLSPDFIEIIEQDHLHHWLWGRYRFLSGDDKSTWYYLLKEKAEMFYIPDVTTVTIEIIKGNPLSRMRENLRRWSGNTLRNGARAIALGPQTVGFFIWWCIVDQRIAMWNMPIGLMIIALTALTKNISVLLIYLIWIGFSRLCLSTVLFYYGKRIDMSFPFIIYFNQIMTSFIKIYILFRLPQQRWQNRGNQQAGFAQTQQWPWRDWVANSLTVFYLLLFLVIILLYLDIISLPTFTDIKTISL